MKENKFFSIILMIFLCVFTSCSDEDNQSENEGTLNTSLEKYSEYAASYESCDHNSSYREFIFLGDGTYIIITSNYSNYVSRTSHSTFSSFITRLHSNGLISGNYSVDDEGKHILEGFGEVLVCDNSNGKYTLSYDGKKLDCKKKINYDNNSKTLAFCRTWKIDKIVSSVKVNGKDVCETTYTGGYIPSIKVDGELKDLFDEEETIADFAYKATFSPFGYYITYFNNDEYPIEITNWKWKDISKGEFFWFDDDVYDSSIAKVSFSGNKCTVEENYDVYDEEIEYVEKVLGYEVKTLQYNVVSYLSF